MSRAGGSHPVDENRPMTAVRAAGYTSAGRSNAGAAFDPTGQGGRLCSVGDDKAIRLYEVNVAA